MSVPARAMNDLFMSKLASGESKEKLAELGGNYIRDRLREVSFADKVLPPEQVTRADCQISINHDTLVKIVWLEPKSRAMTMSFRGQPTARFIRSERTECAFYTISSEMMQKTEQELLVYDMPITRIIEENIVKDMQEIKDREFTLNVESCVQALQTEANGGTATALNASGLQAGTVVEYSIRKGELARTATTNDATVRPLQRPDLVNLFKMLDGRRLRAERILVTEVDWDDLLQWTVEDFGDRIQSETAVDGYKYNTVLGRGLIRTVKVDILRPGNIYCFTKPEFFGRSYILNAARFYVDKIANLISFQSWMDVGMILANVAAVVKTELYSGDAASTDSDSLLASFIPVSEDALGAANNRIESGLRVPAVVSY